MLKSPWFRNADPRGSRSTLRERYLYVLNLASESVSAFAIDWETGTLQAVVSSPFPVGAKPSSVEG